MKTAHARVENSLLLLALALAYVLPTLPAEPGQLKWSFDTGGPVYSCPAIGADGTVFVGSLDTRVYAVDGVTGSQKWAFATGGEVYSSPALGADGTVYVGSKDKRLYALDGTTGAQKWAYLTDGEVVASPAVGADGTVYVGSGTANSPVCHLLALDGASGTRKWAFATGYTYDSSPAIGRDGTVYFGAGYGGPGGALHALNAMSGTQKWVSGIGGGASSSPAIGADGTVYIGSFDVGGGRVYALNETTGAERWRFATGGMFTSSAPVIGADGTVYVGGGGGDRKFYALDGATGVQKWAFVAGRSVGRSPALAADGTLYFGDLDGKVYALNGATGVQERTYTTGGAVTAPALGVDGTIYFGSADGKLYALQGLAGLADAPWPKFRHDARNTGRRGFVPWVFQQPSRAVLKEGAVGQITVGLDVQPVPDFRWLRNGQAIPGATETTLTIPLVTRADEGLYTVIASNAVGQVTSDPIRALVSNVDPESFVGLKWEGGSVGPVSLEASAQLGALATWHSISNYPSSSTPQQYVGLDPADAVRFYRLNAPVALQFTTAGLLNGWWLTEPADTRIRIEMVSAATGSTTWQELTTLTLPASPYLFLDLESLGAPERVYRTTVVP